MVLTKFDQHSQELRIINFYIAGSPTQIGTIASQELELAIVVTGSAAVYILSLAVFCVCGILCGCCTLKHKESVQRPVALHKAERQVHPPPRYPAPVYEDTKLQPEKAKREDEPGSELQLINATTENQAYSTTLKSSAPIYEGVLPGRGEVKKNVIEIQLEDLEMKENVAYGPV